MEDFPNDCRDAPALMVCLGAQHLVLPLFQNYLRPVHGLHITSYVTLMQALIFTSPAWEVTDRELILPIPGDGEDPKPCSLRSFSACLWSKLKLDLVRSHLPIKIMQAL